LDKPETLGPAMAVALITTFYGVLLANLWFMPLARRLEDKTIIEISHKEMIIEGVLSIQAGENPRIIEEKLKAFLSQEEQENVEVNKRFNVAGEMQDG
jgi:chemotaxis protein MotA